MTQSLTVSVDVHECPGCRSADVVATDGFDEELAVAWGCCDHCGPVPLVPRGLVC